MQQLHIKKKNFEDSISNINYISKQHQGVQELQKFKEKGLIFNHRITGNEMNEFVIQLQKIFIEINRESNQFYQQFIEVYKAFDSLNKDYIQAIVTSYNQAVDATKKAEVAQRDVEKTIDLLKESVKKILAFNSTVSTKLEELEKFSSATIDNFERIGKNISTTFKRIEEFNSKVNSELSMIDGDNWKENAMKHQAFLNDIDAKADEIIVTLNSYKEQYNIFQNEYEVLKQHEELIKAELEKCNKERKKYIFNLRICWILTGAMFIFMIIFLIIML